MKKIILLFITLILFIPNVYAFKEGDKVTIQKNGQIPVSYIYESSSGSIENRTYDMDIYKAAYQKQEYAAYCIDPNGHAELNNVVIKKIISNTSKYDYGILAILKETNNYSYTDILVALRLYVNYVWNTSSGYFCSGGSGAAYMRAHLKLFQAVADAGLYQSITGNSISSPGNGHCYMENDRPHEVKANYAGANEGNVGVLLNKAMEATKDDGNNVDIPKVTMKKEREEEDKDKKTIVVSVKLENFDFSDESDSSFIYEGIEGNDEVIFKGYSTNINSNPIPLPENENIFKKFPNNHIIYLTYEVDLKNIKDTEDECAFTFKINYKYQDVNSIQGALIFSAVPSGNNPGDQRFIIFDSDEISSSFDVNGDCEKDKCEATTNYPEICQDGTETDADGNAKYEFKEGITGNDYDIVKCILGNKDMADNKYEFTDNENAPILEMNPYCSVYCKEDYSFNVPYKRETLSGRFFQIDMGIKGQKTCYSSQIQYEKFKNEILEVQNQIYEAYNKYLKHRDLLAKMDFVDASHDYYSYEWNDEIEDYISISQGSCPIWDMKYKQVDKKEDKTSGVINIYNEHKVAKTYGSIDSNYPQPDKCNDGKIEYNSDKHQENMNAARQDLITLVKKLKKQIDYFNGCSGSEYYKGDKVYSEAFNTLAEIGWKMSYNFKPDVTYRYDEPIGYTPKWIVPGNGYDKMIVLNQKTEARVCDSNATNCTSADVIQDIFDNSTIKTAVYCGGDDKDSTMLDVDIDRKYNCVTGAKFDDNDSRSYLTIKCDDTGCEQEEKEYNISKIRYVKQTARGEITLTTPRVFFSRHDDGNILIGNYDITPDNHDRVNGLPVAATTPRGQYFYILSINNLGEFYDNPKNLGRIFSKSLTNNVMDKIENRPTNYAVPFDIQSNEYACTYIVKHHCVNETDGTIHTEAECKIGEDWTTCSQRICGCDNPPCTWNGNELIIPDDPDPSNPQFNLNISFRPISPNNIKPNAEPMGYNWNTMIGNLKNHLIAIKAGNTIAEIKNRNNIDNVENLSPGDIQKIDDYNFKIKLTPSMVTWIKKYNDENEDKGSFGNNTLDCTSYILESINNEKECTSKGYNWDNGQCKMANIFCTSNFIDELMNPDNGFNQYIDAPGRDKAKDTAASNFHKYEYIKDKLENADNIVTNDYWTIYVYDNIDVLYDGDKSDGLASVGPSWK